MPLGGTAYDNVTLGGNANYKSPQQLQQEQDELARQRQQENEATSREAAAKAQRDADANMAAWRAQNQPQQTYASPNQAAMQGLNDSSPSYQSGSTASYYTGAPTSPMQAQQQQLQLESEFAGKNLQQKAGIDTSAMNQSAKLQAEAEARRMSQLPQIMQTLGAGDQGPSGGMSANEEAARSAAFSRAKDQRGQIALSQLKSLQDTMAGRGLQGSTIESGHLGDILAEAGGGLEDFSNEQAILDVNRAGAISDRDYQGNLVRRGQNLGLAPSLLGLVGQRALY